MTIVKGGPETGLVCWALKLDSALNTRNLVECCPGGYLRMMGGKVGIGFLEILLFSWEPSNWFPFVGTLDCGH